MTEQELRTNCETMAPAGCAKSLAVLKVLDELAALRASRITRVAINTVRVYAECEDCRCVELVTFHGPRFPSGADVDVAFAEVGWGVVGGKAVCKKCVQDAKGKR